MDTVTGAKNATRNREKTGPVLNNGFVWGCLGVFKRKGKGIEHDINVKSLESCTTDCHRVHCLWSHMWQDQVLPLYPEHASIGQ